MEAGVAEGGVALVAQAIVRKTIANGAVVARVKARRLVELCSVLAILSASAYLSS
jgi:hypothetical protein